MTAEILINTYLDANILLLVAFGLWSLVLALLARSTMRHAYTTHLKLLNGVVLAIAACPLVVWLLGGWSTQNALNLSDLIVAQYLDGKFSVSATQLEQTLGLRESFVRGLAQGQNPLIWLFAAGFSGFSLILAHNAYRLRRLLQNARDWRRLGRIRILLSDTALVPFSTRSLHKHYIVIPTAMLDNDADVRIAIGHELQHFRQRDVEWAILLELLTPLFFWNPVFHLWKRKVSALREYACDQTLVARPTYDARAYGECLLRACKRNLRGGKNFVVLSPAVPLINANCPLTGGQSSQLKNRIIALTSQNTTPQISALLLGIPLAAMVLLMSLFIQRPADWSHDRLMLSTIVNLERLDARNAQAFSQP